MTQAPGLRTVLTIAALAIAAPAHADETVRDPDPALLARHDACSAAAAERLMSGAEAQLCADNYLRLKLSLLPDMDFDTFQGLEARERYAISLEGYRAFLAWKQHVGRPTLALQGDS